MEVLITDPFYSSLFVGLGIILFLLEIFIPSGGVLGLFALATAGFGVYGFFHQDRYLLGSGALFTALAAGFVILKYGLRRLELTGSLPPETSYSQAEGIADFEGREGVTLTALRPAGLALIDGKRVDVVASGKFIEKDRTIRVVETSGNRIVVRETQGS